MLTAKVPSFSSLSRFPALRRDLALVVDDKTAASEIEHCLNSIKSDILKSIQLFDVYSGSGVEQGKKSIAVAFQLQHAERTLTDEDVESLMNTVTHTLEKHVGATIRS